MKRKKKNAIQLISLLLVLAVLIGGYLWYSNWKKTSGTASGDDSTEELTLGTLDTAQVNSLHYKAKDADLTFTLDNGVWKSQTDPNRPINQTNVQNLLNLVTTVKATRVINEHPEDLSEYGLSEPKGYLQASQADGKTLTVQIGDGAIGNSGYYALFNDDGKVYLMSTSYSTGIGYSDNDMTALEQGPTITADNIRHILIDNRDKEDFELQFNRDNTLDNSGTNMFPWVILKPYDVPYSADYTKVNDILANYSDFNLTSCVDYDAKDLSKYGLDNPVSSIYVQYYVTTTVKLNKPETDPTTGKEITEKQEQTDMDYKIYVGSKDSDGDYYIKKDGSNAVYTMYADTVDKMLNVDAFSLINKYVNVPNIKNVDKVTADIGGVQYTMEIKRTPSKDADGNDTTTETYYYNGKEVTHDEFQPVYEAIISAKYDSLIGKDVSAEGLKPVMTISYHLGNDKNITLTESFLPYNDNFYLVDTGSKILFFADKRSIDDLAKIIQDFKVPTTGN